MKNLPLCIGASFLLATAFPAVAEEMPKPVGIADVRWTGAYWGDQRTILLKESLPSMTAIMEGEERSFLRNFRIAAGRENGEHRGPPWNDGDCYKWLEAMAAAYASEKDARLGERMDAAIAVIAAAQAADGYLHTPVLIRTLQGGDARPFHDRHNFEMYNFGHLFTTACVHKRATGKDSLLLVARKAADHLCRKFDKPTPELANNSICPSHYMGLVELFRLTGERRYLELAGTLIAMRELVREGGDDNQDRVPFREQRTATGHAVRANYLYAGIADYAIESEDRTLLEPLRAIWSNAAGRKMYITGACGALYDGASPDGSKEQKAITRVHQAYGRDYQLPNSTAHNETCASIGNLLWNSRMFQLTGDARHADLVETSLLNAIPAGIGLDGRTYFYTNTLRQLDNMPAELRWSRQREPWISCFCCPPNVVRTLLQSQAYAYSVSEASLWVNLFGSNDLSCEVPARGRLRLSQRTEYPWEGHVTISVKEAPSKAVGLRIRIPGWCDGAAVRVNGGPPEHPKHGYHRIERVWECGDAIEIELPMRTRLVESHPLVEETRGQAAVCRGPMVYCLESNDLPQGVKLTNVRLAADPAFRAERGAAPGGGAGIRAKAFAMDETPWRGELYRERASAAARSIEAKLIPYYAWGNRGKSEMSVWLPVK